MRELIVRIVKIVGSKIFAAFAPLRELIVQIVKIVGDRLLAVSGKVIKFVSLNLWDGFFVCLGARMFESNPIRFL